MRADVYRFAGEIEPPQLFVSPLIDRGIGTLRGNYANDYGTRRAVLNAIQPELTDSDRICFADLDERRTPDMDTLLDRFEDITGGVHPGHPTVKYRDVDPDAKPENIMDISSDHTIARLKKFYEMTRLQPRLLTKSGDEPYMSDERSWIGDANKFYARVRLPEKNPQMRSFLHELGHCSMALVGLSRNTETAMDGLRHSLNVYWSVETDGLTYLSEDGEKGEILEEAVAEGLGALVNRKLGLVRTHHNDEIQQMPEIVAPYMVGTSYSGSAPASVALELIAKELGIPSNRYFRMFVDYADNGVRNADARQEIAETIYRGTRGRLTLSQLEELPYPINKEASLALLWAVEDSLDVPDHERYADFFFYKSTNR